MKYLLTISTLLIVAFAALAQENDDNLARIHIGPYTQDCVGVAPQECMIVSWDDETNYSYFYDSIQGFTYETGFEYTLTVRVTERENVPADASSLLYELVEVEQKLPASIEDRIWQLQSLYDTLVDDPSQYTLLITEDGTSIQADCNSVMANTSLQPFSIETTISTLAMCPEDSLESAYTTALNDAIIMTIENGELILQSSEGQLRFAPPAINETEWIVTTAHLSDDNTLSLTEADPYTLLIEVNRATMTLSCNFAGAEIDVIGAVITFDDVEMTQALCEYDPLTDIYPPETTVYHVTAESELVFSFMSDDNVIDLTFIPR